MENSVYFFYFVEEDSNGRLPDCVPTANISVFSTQGMALANAAVFGGKNVEFSRQSDNSSVWLGRDNSVTPALLLVVTPMPIDAGIAVLTT